LETSEDAPKASYSGIRRRIRRVVTFKSFEASSAERRPSVLATIVCRRVSSGWLMVIMSVVCMPAFTFESGPLCLAETGHYYLGSIGQLVTYDP
jgi:hypothetical protein